jgi:hypothetical protein
VERRRIVTDTKFNTLLTNGWYREETPEWLPHKGLSSRDSGPWDWDMAFSIVHTNSGFLPRRPASAIPIILRGADGRFGQGTCYLV